MGRSMAQLAGDPRPEKMSEVLAVYRWVLAVRPMVLKLGRQPTVTALASMPMVLLPRVDATDERSISLHKSSKYNLRFWEIPSMRPENSADFWESLAYPDCRRCTTAGADEMTASIRTGKRGIAGTTQECDK